jgi:hypothetical protein
VKKKKKKEESEERREGSHIYESRTAQMHNS